MTIRERRGRHVASILAGAGRLLGPADATEAVPSDGRYKAEGGAARRRTVEGGLAFASASLPELCFC